MSFFCKPYQIEIPITQQVGFCAIQHRKGRDFCVTCEHGMEAAREELDMAMYKKKCGVCGEEFTGGPTAKTCKKCKEASDPKPKKPKKAPARSATAEKPVSHGNGNGVHESVKVLDTLIAIGAVTEEQVDATRRYVQEMFA